MTDSAQLRFVLLRHDVSESFGRASHWDLMIERSGLTQEHRLATWALESLPSDWAHLLALKQNERQEPNTAKQLPDHRAQYLDYEGPVSGDRGAVTRCLSGYAKWLTDSESFLMLKLQIKEPSPLTGILNLVAMNSNGSDFWTLKWDGKPQQK